MSEQTIIEIAKALEGHKEALNFYLYMQALEPIFVIVTLGIACTFFYKIIKQLN